MAEPSRPTVKRLFALSGNICAFPSCSVPMVEDSGTVTGEICHIHAQSKGGPRYEASLSVKKRHEFENLMLLCGRHHKVIDSEEAIYTAETLRELKSVHESAAGRPESEQDNFYAQILLNAFKSIHIEANSGNVAINSPGSIQGQNVTVRTSSKSVKIEPPPESLGAHPVYSRYITYLIQRYNKFASAEPNRKSKFSYGAISKNIESRFGAPWKLLGSEYSAEVIAYLQKRIDQTRQARTNKGKGYCAYSSLEEYIEKYGAKVI